MPIEYMEDLKGKCIKYLPPNKIPKEDELKKIILKVDNEKVENIHRVLHITEQIIHLYSDY